MYHYATANNDYCVLCGMLGHTPRYCPWRGI